MSAEFDQFSDDYERLVTDPVRSRFGGGSSDFFHQRKIKLLLEFLKRKRLEPSRMAWLDVGCGQGDLLKLGSGHFLQRRGCDPSEGMLSSADSGIEVRRQASATSLPYDSAAFDLVSAVCVYHHVVPEDRVALTAEVRRVLKPGGTFVMIEHNPLNPVTRLVVSRVPLDRDAQLLSARTARAICSLAGLKPFSTDYFLYFPKSLYPSVGWTEAALRKVPLGGQYAAYALR